VIVDSIYDQIEKVNTFFLDYIMDLAQGSLDSSWRMRARLTVPTTVPMAAWVYYKQTNKVSWNCKARRIDQIAENMLAIGASRFLDFNQPKQSLSSFTLMKAMYRGPHMTHAEHYTGPRNFL
jgi:hypothetical protein